MSNHEEAHARSHDLAQAMEGMINDVLQKHGGGVVVGFTTFIQYVDETGERNFSFFCAPEQTTITTVGQVAYINKIVDQSLDEALAR